MRFDLQSNSPLLPCNQSAILCAWAHDIDILFPAHFIGKLFDVEASGDEQRDVVMTVFNFVGASNL